ENQNIIDKNTLKAMKNVRKSVYRNHFFSKKQTSLDLFVESEDSNFKSNDTFYSDLDGNNNMNREGINNIIIDIENINFGVSYLMSTDFMIMKMIVKVLLNTRSIRISFINNI